MPNYGIEALHQGFYTLLVNIAQEPTLEGSALLNATLVTLSILQPPLPTMDAGCLVEAK